MTESTPRPLLTFALMAYNSEIFVEEAIMAAFSQSYEPLEIILSDDCSIDRSFEIMKKMADEYGGPHKIILNRNEHNVGVSGHINRVMELCSGQMMVIAAADDVSLQHRVEKTYEAYMNSGCTALSIHSSCILIDEAGAEIGRAQELPSYEISLESVIDNGTWLYGCTHAWHRDVFDKFGPLPLAVRQEDEVIPFRSLLLGRITYVKEPLVRYRLHDSNWSHHTRSIARSRKEFKDLTANQYQQKLNNLACYLCDLETAGSILEENRRKHLRVKLLQWIKRCELELAIRNEKVRVKLLGLIGEIADGLDVALIAKLLFRILFPKTFISFAFYKYRKTLKEQDLPITGRP